MWTKIDVCFGENIKVQNVAKIFFGWLFDGEPQASVVEDFVFHKKKLLQQLIMGCV